MNKIFEPRSPIRVKDLSEINVEALLTETYTMTPIQCITKNPDGSITKKTVRNNYISVIPHYCKIILYINLYYNIYIIFIVLYDIYKK